LIQTVRRGERRLHFAFAWHCVLMNRRMAEAIDEEEPARDC
jgi:hypothetical protein